MLREDFTLEEFGKIFQAFNDAVYRGDAQKLAYKSWRNINAWTKDNYEKMRVSKEWVRCCEGHDNPYQYHDEERIFVGPYDSNCACPNPEELDPNDGSLGSWLDGVLIREPLMALNSCNNDMNKVAYAGATAYDALARTNVSSLKTAMESLQSGICTINDTGDYYYSTGTDWINVATPTYELKSDNLYIDGEPFDNYIKSVLNAQEEKEKETMNFNFDFGPVDSSVRMSMYGMAVKNANGNYVAYDAANNRIMDVDILNFEGANKFMYKMPVAVKDVAVGDIVVHMRKPMIVLKAHEDNTFTVVDVYNGEEKIIIPANSPFGWSFMTKVVSFINFGSADASNPFGNMLPLLLLSDSKSKDDNLLPLMLMAGGNMDMSNPMMMYALMGNRTNDPMMLMLAMGAFNKPATTVCSGNCTCHKAD